MPAPATEPPRRWRLALLLYPFTAAAVAINLFMAALLGQWVGFAAISPWWAIALSVPLGVPATWLATRWVGGMIDEAEGRG